jgi:predicted transposase YdaD
LRWTIRLRAQGIFYRKCELMKPKYDMLWKSMIEEIMADLLLFVDPGIGKVLDLERGFEFLDKELADIFPDPIASNLKAVDKLVKVFLCDGAERWILLHVEVQRKNGKGFPARMFEYFMRLRRRGHPVAAIAILTGEEAEISPGVYEDLCLWTSVRYEYKTLRLVDYSDEWLAASTNPFAAVLLVAKEALLKLTGSDDERDRVLLEQKLLIDRLLNEKEAAFGERKTRAIKYFLYNYVVFKNPETNRKFVEESNKDKNNITMGIIEQMHEIKRQEGIEEGRREGIQEGLENAVQKLLVNTALSPEEIAKVVEVPLSLVKKIKRELEGK